MTLMICMFRITSELTSHEFYIGVGRKWRFVQVTYRIGGLKDSGYKNIEVQTFATSDIF